MSKRPWMPFYVADYLKDTRHLTTLEHGAYLLLIMEYWVKGGLPGQDRQLARIAGMRIAEWRAIKPTIAAFFHDEWRHKRLDAELAKAMLKTTARQTAGRRGGIASAKGKQKPSNAAASSSDSEKDSDPNGSGASAPDDPRTRLFRDGLQALARMTGKGPDACRAFVGKCLKAASDDAVIVLGLIDDAERNRVANPTAWIAARLKGQSNEKTGSLLAAFDRIISEDVDSPAGENPVLGLPPGPIRRS
jgi:uncharacterized protein YdaU (DUF1376 family)